MPRFQPDQPSEPSDSRPQPGPRTAPARTAAEPRLNVLLSYGGWREQSVVDQLPHLLQPMGIRSIRVESCDQAADVIRREAIHIAVVDLAIPLHCTAAGESMTAVTPSIAEPGGPRILQLLRRLEPTPPTVVVRPPQPTTREAVRTLSDALRQGAFAVIDNPVRLETLLEVMRRILRRHYADLWPTN